MRSTGNATSAMAPMTSQRLTCPFAARAPTPSRAGTAGRGIPTCSATTSAGRRSTLCRSRSSTLPIRSATLAALIDDGLEEIWIEREAIGVLGGGGCDRD